MKFAYVIETISKNGVRDTRGEEFEKDELLIGRGSNCDILLPGKLVSLNHAKIHFRDNELLIEDLKSLNGVRVNNQVVSRASLKVGDTVQIGNYEFKVIRLAGNWGFSEQRKEEKEEEKAPAQTVTEDVGGRAERLILSKRLPSFTVLSISLSAIVFVLFFILPLGGWNVLSWNSGPISNHHRLIADKCETCHETPFTPVQDAQCVLCHQLSDHAPNLAKVVDTHPNLALRCATCHMEHNGDRALIAENSTLCVDCHGKLKEIFPESHYVSIGSFDKHPEFAVAAQLTPQTEAVTNPSLKRVRLDDPQYAIDNTQLKLNHKVHLEPGILGPEGPENLQCLDCHKFSEDLKHVLPINFEEHCSRCHQLTFDERLPDKTVPHGDPQLVYNTLYAEFSKLFLNTEGVESNGNESDGEDSGLVRRKPGVSVEVKQNIEFTRASVRGEARRAERLLFERSACFLCHTVTETNVAQANEVTGQAQPETEGSLFTVVKPNVPLRWMPASTYTHASHQFLGCTECHHGVETSEQTTDLLLPKLAICQECHSEQHSLGKVEANCITCHSYHDSELISNERKRAVREIIG